MEAQLQQRMEALSEAEQRHGSIEERIQQLETKVSEKESELQRVRYQRLFEAPRCWWCNFAYKTTIGTDLLY